MLKNKGYEVHVAASNDMDLSVDVVKHIVPIARNPLKFTNIRAYRELKKLVDSEKFDITHCHTPMGAALTRVAALKARKNGTKVIYTAHGFHFYKGAPPINWIIYYPIEKFCSYFTDILITINKEDYERAKKKFHAKRIEYVKGVGIDLDKFGNVDIDKSQKRKELGLSNTDIVVLSVGELTKRKNHETVIRAISAIDNPNIKYIICGCGVLERKLKDLIKELRLENQVFLLGYRNDIADISTVSDISILPSHQEGLAVALMEAMARGLPVVCSNIRGNTDLISDGKGGFLVECNDIKGLAEKITILSENRELMTKMGRVNLNRIKKFGLEIIKKEMEKIYFN